MTIRDGRKETERKPTHKQQQRRQRTLELRCNGLTIPMINVKLHEEGFQSSEHTVFDDLHSETADEFLEELKRQQLADITRASTDYKTRLQYRGQMIEILTPKKIETKNDNTNKYTADPAALEILKLYEKFNAGLPIPDLCSEQPVHSEEPQTNCETENVSTT